AARPIYLSWFEGLRSRRALLPIWGLALLASRCSQTSRSWASIPALQRKALRKRKTMAKQSKDSDLGGLQRFVVTLQANKDELGHLEGPITKLTDLVGQSQEVAKEQAAFIAGKQE